MRVLTTALAGLALVAATTLGIAQPRAGVAGADEYNGADVAAAARPVEAANGMVVSSSRHASQVGADILRAGGNAVDAAVAVGYALAVTHATAGNIGGGGFATIRLANGRETFINFREKAPAAARPDMYLDAAGNVVPGRSTRGWLAVGVPGTVMGLERMLTEYGTMPRAQAMAPAIRLADEGYVLRDVDARAFTNSLRVFTAQPNVARIFTNDGRPWQAGDRFVQRELAATLRLIAEQGPDAFYRGPIAAKVAAASRAGGGIITAQDFADYTVTEGAPLTCSYRGTRIVSAPPPSSGGVSMCEILTILSGYRLDRLPARSAQSVHLMVEAMRHAYVDRNFELGDPAYVKNPLARLLSARHAAAIRARIDPVRATPSAQVRFGMPPHESEQTTHYSVVDAKGNAVSVTYTLNGGYGAQIMAGDTGFFLNNEMDDFTSKPGVPNMFGLVQGTSNSVQPGKRPLSSMAPTIVTKGGRLFMVTGSPGGSRIITIVLGTILNVVDHGMDMKAAVNAPRIHHQWMPDTVYLEPRAVTPAVRAELENRGYSLTENRNWGSAQAIMVGGRGRKRTLYGASDDRDLTSAAVGY